MNKLFIVLEKNIKKTTFDELKFIFQKITKLKSTTILLQFSRTIGFCCFIGNSLQNANIINQLSFDYWDSTHYIISYIVSRFYKIYLFADFIPLTLIYVFILIKSVSGLLEISDKEMGEYPIKNYTQLNTLCNFGLNVLLTMLIPLIFSSLGVYFIHVRFDITTITTIIISSISTLTSLGMCILLIHKFYASIIEYKNNNIEKIDSELSEIHEYIFNFQFDIHDDKKLKVYLKKEKYLSKVKEQIKALSKFPLATKAIFTSISPFLPVLFKIMDQCKIYFLS